MPAYIASLALVITIYSSKGQKQRSIGKVVKASQSCSNAIFASSSYSYARFRNLRSFFFPVLALSCQASFYRSFNGLAIRLQLQIKRLQKFAKLRNTQMSQYDLGFSYSRIDYTCEGSIQRPQGEIIKLRNLTILIQKAYLLILAQSFYCLSLLSTIIICFLYSASSSKKIRMLSRYTTQIVSKRPLRALFIQAQKLARALARLKGITLYLKCLYLMRKAVFYSSPSLMQSLQQASQRFNLVQMFACDSQSIILLISRSRYQFLTIILLSPQQSIHILMLLRIEALARDLLSQTICSLGPCLGTLRG